MIVDTGAYILSLILVLLACVIRDFLIPIFIWRKHLKGRSFGYCFWFAIIFQASMQINLVLFLGIFNILNSFTYITFNILIYLLILWNYSDKKFFQRLRNFFTGLWIAFKEERLIGYLKRHLIFLYKSIYRKIYYWSIWRKVKNNWIEILLLLGIIIYNIWFLTHNLMIYHCYQFSDIPVHQSWIWELEQGNLYSDGIYPFGMHIMIYFVRVFFGLNLREIMLYTGAYYFVILIIGVYLLAKEIFVGKYNSLAAVIITSLMLNQGRYGAALPQEAGMYAVVAIGYFMIRYLHRDKKNNIIETDSRLRNFVRINSYINKKYIDSEMLLLMLSVSLVISYHYYTALSAVFAVIAIGLAYIPKIFKKQYFIPLLFCGLFGALIALIPTGICLAKGISFQESIDWAKTVIAGESWHGREADYQEKLAMALGADEYLINASLKDDSEKLDSCIMENSAAELIKSYIKAVYNFTSRSMFGKKPTKLYFICMITGFISGIIMVLSKKNRVYGYDYIALIIMVLIFFTLGASKELGIVELIAANRASTFAEPFTGLIYLLPIDFIFRVLPYNFSMGKLSLLICCACPTIIINAGCYHEFFDFNQTYYNEAEYVLRNIKKSYKKYSYTIVSPTDEYYDVIDHGRHTELSQFVNMINKNEDKFFFTTDYVFFFIEKLVLQDYYYGRVKVDLKYALKDFIYMEDVQDYYYQRAVIESKAYFWAKKFHEMYPKNFKVYFENDIYMVYLMEQNTYFPYDLQIDYLEDYKDTIESKVNEKCN